MSFSLLEMMIFIIMPYCIRDRIYLGLVFTTQVNSAFGTR